MTRVQKCCIIQLLCNDTYGMYNYNIKYNAEVFYTIIKYRKFSEHFLRGIFEKLARRLARWHAKLKHVRTVQHVSKQATLARRHTYQVIQQSHFELVFQFFHIELSRIFLTSSSDKRFQIPFYSPGFWVTFCQLNP